MKTKRKFYFKKKLPADGLLITKILLGRNDNQNYDNKLKEYKDEHREDRFRENKLF